MSLLSQFLIDGDSALKTLIKHSVRGSTLDVRFRRLWASDSDV